MKVRFKQAVRYSEDGFNVLCAEKHEVRDVAHSTACALICGKVADNFLPEGIREGGHLQS